MCYKQVPPGLKTALICLRIAHIIHLTVLNGLKYSSYYPPYSSEWPPREFLLATILALTWPPFSSYWPPYSSYWPPYSSYWPPYKLLLAAIQFLLAAIIQFLLAAYIAGTGVLIAHRIGPLIALTGHRLGSSYLAFI